MQNNTYLYDFIAADVARDHSIPVIVKDHNDLNTFINYVKEYICDINEKIPLKLEASNSCYIAITGCLITAYRMNLIGGKLAGIEMFLKNKHILSYNSDDNLCLFAAIASMKYAVEFKKCRSRMEHITRLAKKVMKIITKHISRHIRASI
jgi:hypothetical protein